MNNTPSSASPRRLALSPRTEKLVAGGLLLVAIALLVFFFDRLPIEGTSLGIDWLSLWDDLIGGVPRYTNGLRSPVWSIWPLLPLGLLSFRASWGLLVVLTIIVTMLSVPRAPDRRLWLISVALVVVSFPSLRHLVDGNLEGLIIAGVLLALWGFEKQNAWVYTIGVLLATAKVQETWLFLLVLGVYTLRCWPRRTVALIAGAMVVIVIISLVWTGQAWLNTIFNSPYPGTIIDINLRAAVHRLGLPDWLGYGLWLGVLALTLSLTLMAQPTFSRFKAAALIAASLLLAPYAAGNSFLTVLAIGIIPLFQWERYRWLGLGLIVLADLPFLASHDLLWWQAYYWTALLLVAWGIFLGLVRQEKAKGPQ